MNGDFFSNYLYVRGQKNILNKKNYRYEAITLFKILTLVDGNLSPDSHMQPMENLSVAYLHLHSVIGISLCKICDVTKRSPSDRLPVLVVSWRGCTPSQSCVVPKSSGIALLQTENKT